MKYIGLTSSSASGKASGLVATRGRIGSQFRAHVISRQVLTVSSSEARSITGSLPSLWRKLTAAEQSTWSDLASSLTTRDALGQSVTLSGYALYIGCARRLVTIGVTQQLTAAPAPSSIPSIYGFTATPVYNPPGAAPGLADIQLSTATPMPPSYTPVLRASAALSMGRFNIRASNLRIIQAGVVWASGPHSVLALWLAVYGTLPAAGTITFELSLVDPASGLVGTAVRTQTSYRYVFTRPPTPGTVEVEVEGTVIAEIPDTWVELNGNVIAE